MRHKYIDPAARGARERQPDEPSGSNFPISNGTADRASVDGQPREISRRDASLPGGWIDVLLEATET